MLGEQRGTLMWRITNLQIQFPQICPRLLKSQVRATRALVYASSAQTWFSESTPYNIRTRIPFLHPCGITHSNQRMSKSWKKRKSAYFKHCISVWPWEGYLTSSMYHLIPIKPLTELASPFSRWEHWGSERLTACPRCPNRHTPSPLSLRCPTLLYLWNV